MNTLTKSDVIYERDIYRAAFEKLLETAKTLPYGEQVISEVIDYISHKKES